VRWMTWPEISARPYLAIPPLVPGRRRRRPNASRRRRLLLHRRPALLPAPPLLPRPFATAVAAAAPGPVVAAAMVLLPRHQRDARPVSILIHQLVGPHQEEEHLAAGPIRTRVIENKHSTKSKHSTKLGAHGNFRV